MGGDTEQAESEVKVLISLVHYFQGCCLLPFKGHVALCSQLFFPGSSNQFFFLLL